jgi:putative transposase
VPRFPRLFVQGLPLHIAQRGHDRQPVFTHAADFEHYLTNIRAIKEDLSIRVFGYCLMTNHVHLIVSPKAEVDNVSKFMRVLAARQTRYVNKRKNRTGTLWEGRFKSSLIDTDRYLLTCLQYVDLNPLRAAIVASPEDYRWSSYRSHAGTNSEEWLDNCAVYDALGADPTARANAYARLVSHGIKDEKLLLIRTALQRNQVTGDQRFRSRIATRTGQRISALPPGRPRSSN